jgi:hypothetical protein
MTNLIEQAIIRDDADRAAKMIQEALGIESDDVVNYCFPKTRPADRERRARIIGAWLMTEVCYLPRDRTAASPLARGVRRSYGQPTVAALSRRKHALVP